MTQQVLFSYIYSVVAGVTIEIFFQLVKYRDSLNTDAPWPATAYGEISDASNYMSVSQYLSGGSRKWVNYFLFRLLPLLIILTLLSGVLSRYFHVKDYLPYTLVAAGTSLLFRDLLDFFKATLISEKLLHIANIALVLALAVFVGYLADLVNFSFIAPSLSGLIDNLWSALLVAALILFYLRITNMSTKHQDDYAEEIAINNYITHSYNEVKSRYSGVIDHACQEYFCSKRILYAVLIHENMNRPIWIRTIENGLVRFFGLKLTVGIAQVSSDRPLTDEESIEMAAKILKGSTYADSGYGDGFANIGQLAEVLKNYNSSEAYVKSISQIITKLRIYANEVFEERTRS